MSTAKARVCSLCGRPFALAKPPASTAPSGQSVSERLLQTLGR